MLNDYRDIRSRIPEEPKWFDANGAPRYDVFHPDLVPDIYADTAVLYRIHCQSCGVVFQVAESSNMIKQFTQRDGRTVETDVVEAQLHYGDPPAHGCVGDTMNSIPLKVLQFWKRNKDHIWERDPQYEGLDLTPDWAKEEPSEAV
jgi:hypothetical protein